MSKFVSFHQQPVDEWVAQNFPGSMIPDQRLRNRLAVVCSGVCKHPGKHFTRMFENPGDIQAAYDFMSNSKVLPERLQHDHFALSRRRMAQCQSPCLLIEDTTTMSYQFSEQIPGLGPVGTSGCKSQGFLVHSVLAAEVAPDNGYILREIGALPSKVVGLADQQFLVRQPAPDKPAKNAKGNKRRKGPDPNQLESQLWLNPFLNIGRPPQNKSWVYVSDRGSDIYEYLVGCQEQGCGFCVRAAQDRVLEGEQGGKLLERVRQMPPDEKKILLQLRARQGKPARLAELSISWLDEVVIQAPQRPGYKAGSLPGLKLSVVRVWEEVGKEPLEWILLVSDQVKAADKALWWVRAYATRWLVEEYHKGVKSGLGAEALQLETGQRLMNAVAVMAIVALRLLALRETARTSADLPANQSGLEATELKVLALHFSQRKIETVRDVIMAVGRMGGHMNRKGDGLPGWQTLWRGMEILRPLTAGYELAIRRKRYD